MFMFVVKWAVIWTAAIKFCIIWINYADFENLYKMVYENLLQHTLFIIATQYHNIGANLCLSLDIV